MVLKEVGSELVFQICLRAAVGLLPARWECHGHGISMSPCVVPTCWKLWLTRMGGAAQALGHKETLAYEPWPEVVEKYLASDTFKLPIQVLSRFWTCQSGGIIPPWISCRVVAGLAGGADKVGKKTGWCGKRLGKPGLLIAVQ